ncbi:hypothetical protein [Pandoraea bronchicola]|uniref:Uncharacterized protein n=1 Tax=Pandoraea bronchicola TaxID=2508287 RepID=A0A5E5BQP9_9BURK|nr:hypothetical protein [Pandoraea bronchicola]VVE87718.1 hypothetical protein PBR20603_01656 [Pandoraea bronchicola]
MELALKDLAIWHAAQVGWILAAIAEASADEWLLGFGCLLVAFAAFLVGWLRNPAESNEI